MASFYIVVQYLPDPLAGERINIGVLVYGEGQQTVLGRFLGDWKRVKCFSHQDQDIQIVKEFTLEMTSALKTRRPGKFVEKGPQVTPESLQVMVETWSHNIQLTKPRASLLTPSELLDWAYGRFLHQSIHHKLESRTRLQAAALTKATIRKTLVQVLGQRAKGLLQTEGLIHGLREGHVFDAVVKNGVPYYAAQGFSFEGQDSKDREKEISVLAWMLGDVKNSNPDLPIGFIALPPKNQGDAYEAYQRIQNLFPGLGVDVVTEDELPQWSLDKISDAKTDLQASLEKKA